MNIKRASFYRIKALAVKDTYEYVRDHRTLALMFISALLFPLLGLMITGLKTQQEAFVAVNVCDSGVYTDSLVKLVEEYITRYTSFNVVISNNSNGCGMVPGAIVTLVIPRGFNSNASTVDNPAIVLLYKLVGSPAALEAEAAINNVLASFSHLLAVERVKNISSMAGLEIDPIYVLEPVRVVSETVTATGMAVSPEVERIANIVRFLAFAVFLVLNPTAIAVADTVARERESGTGELLAVTPMRGVEFVLGKALGSVVAIAVAAGLDFIAALVYGYLMFTSSIPLSMAFFHAIQIMLAILVTVSIAVFATLLVPGQRAATLLASMITGVAMLVFFSALFIDIEALPTLIKSVMYMIPYTHIVLAIESYALGDTSKALEHSIVVLVLSILLFIASARVYKPDKLVKR